MSLVAVNTECDNGRDEDKGRLSNVRECAEKCKPISTMFTFESTNQGYCRCQKAATLSGTCPTRNSPGKSLYALKGANQQSPSRPQSTEAQEIDNLKGRHCFFANNFVKHMQCNYRTKTIENVQIFFYIIIIDIIPCCYQTFFSCLFK